MGGLGGLSRDIHDRSRVEGRGGVLGMAGYDGLLLDKLGEEGSMRDCGT